MDQNAKEILTFISRTPKGTSFYQIVRGFGFPDAPYDLRTVLSTFVEQNLVDLVHSERRANAQYSITKKGVEAVVKAM